VIREKEASHLAVAFDLRGPTFRHELYRDYKATRPAMPDDLACQIPYVRKVVEAYNITSLEQQGFEADDLIASAARKLRRQGNEVVLVSGDKDLLQLVGEGITFWDPMSNKVLEQADVLAKYGVPVEHLLDYFALVGDSSDNIPGVPGIGPKTAAKLIASFGSLEHLYANLDQVEQKKLAEKLAANKETALLSRDLIRLREDLEVPDQAGDYRLPDPDNAKLQELFTFLGFSRLLKTQVESPALDKKGYRLLTDLAELRQVVKELGRAEHLVVDTETTSLDPLVAELVGISLCVEAGPAWYLPLAHRLKDGSPAADQPDREQALQILRPLLENRKLAKIGHNLKFDYSVLKTQGIDLAGPLCDTMLASYLVDPNRRSHKLDDLVLELLQIKLTSFDEVTAGQGKGRGKLRPGRTGGGPGLLLRGCPCGLVTLGVFRAETGRIQVAGVIRSPGGAADPGPGRHGTGRHPGRSPGAYRAGP
jgi:DNA polymerase I